MSAYRTRYRVVLDDGRKLEVESTARDSASVTIPTGPDGKPALSLGVGLQIIFNALRRTHAPGIPRSFDDFLDSVVDTEEIDGDPGDDEMDPTQSAPSGG